MTEALRMLSVARRSAVKTRTQTINQLRSLLISAPDDLRDRLWRTKAEQCVVGCARLRNIEGNVLLKTLTATLRLLAKRWLMLSAELKSSRRRLIV